MRHAVPWFSLILVQGAYALVPLGWSAARSRPADDYECCSPSTPKLASAVPQRKIPMLVLEPRTQSAITSAQYGTTAKSRHVALGPTLSPPA